MSEAIQVCIHCGVFMDEHNYEHLARECLPKQIQKLQKELDATNLEYLLSMRKGACYCESKKEDL